MFLMGSLLLGTLAASIPIIIHLLHRQRTQPILWGAMQFLRESPLQFRRRKRVDHWLLMLLRMALLALLAILLARPLLIEGKYNPLSSNLATDIAVVVDHSLSTGRKGGEQTVFEQGLSVVEEVGRLMRPNDTLSVVLAEHRPNLFTPLPIQGSANVAALHSELRELKPGLTDASIPEAVQAARELVGRGRNTQKTIIVVSDEQRSGWQIDNNSAWKLALGERVKGAEKNVRLYSLPLVPENNASDVAVGDLSIAPSLVGVNRPSTVTATIANSGPEDVPAFNAQLVVGGKVIDARPVADLKAGQSRTIRFDHTFTEAGSNWIKVEANAPDLLEASNSAIAAANVWQQLPILVIDGQLTSAGNFKSSQLLVNAMLSSSADPSQDVRSLVQPKLMSVSDVEGLKPEDLDKYAAVVINDVPQLPTEFLSRLAEYGRTGHGVWLIFGPRSEQSFIGQQLAEAGLFHAEVKEKKTAPAGEKGPGIEVRAPQNPTVALLTASERNALTGAVTKQWWSLNLTDGNDQVVLAATSGEPLVMERALGRNGGRVIVWASSVDGQWNSWPLMPNFVPLVNETVYHLASGQTKGLENKRLDAGQPIVWTGPGQPLVKGVQITRPDGKVVEKRPVLANGRHVLSYNDTFDPGLYTVRFDPTEIPQPVYYGVGIDRRELDNTSLTAADLSWLTDRGYLEKKVDRNTLASALGGVNKGTDIWPYLGLILLAMLVVETWLTKRMIGHQARVDVATAGLAKPPPGTPETRVAA